MSEAPFKRRWFQISLGAIFWILFVAAVLIGAVMAVLKNQPWFFVVLISLSLLGPVLWACREIVAWIQEIRSKRK